MKKVKIARRQDSRAHFIVCDALFLPFRPNSFNDIVCTEVLEHIPSYKKIIHNITKLAPKSIYLSFPTENREILLIKASRVYRERHWGKIHVRIVSTSEVINILKNYGYEVQIKRLQGTSTLHRLLAQSVLERINCDYDIPEIGFVSFRHTRLLYRFIVYVSGLLASSLYKVYLHHGLSVLERVGIFDGSWVIVAQKIV